MLNLAFKRTQARMTSVMISQAARTYYPDNVLMKRVTGEYYSDPLEIGERVVRMFALHDNVNDPAAVVPKASFSELGLNALDMCEVFIGLEREFDFEISEEDCESFETVEDVIEFIAKYPATKA